jgi:hypothetical protein
MKIFMVGELLGLMVIYYATYNLFKIHKKIKKTPAGRLNCEKTMRKVDKYKLVGMAGFTFWSIMGLFQVITRK